MMSFESRLAAVERSLAALANEIAILRAEANGSDATPRDDAPRPMQSPRRRRADLTAHDVERLLGRYGMLIIAVLAAVGAVGTFLSWAISRGYLHFDPITRVAIGLAFAAGIGALGIRLRRTERSFGSSLLGLALVVAHVCAYAAGPAFEIVPPLAAFAVVALLSGALAVFALGENDEPLWCVGLAGAAVAPFVTSHHANLYALLGYGALITFPAALTISQRNWSVGWRVFYAVTALYIVVGAGLAAPRDEVARIVALAFPFALAAGAVIPFAPSDRKRGAQRWLFALAVVVLLVDATELRRAAQPLLIAAACASVACLALLDAIADLPQSSIIRSLRKSPTLLDWLDAALIPFALVYLAAGAPATGMSHALAYGACVVAFALFAWRRPIGPLRDAAAVASVIAALSVAPLFAFGPVGHVVVILIIGLGALSAHLARPSFGWLVSGGGVSLFAAFITAAQLTDRRIYEFTPFMTHASLTAAIITVAMIGVARFADSLIGATEALDPPPNSRARLGNVFALAPWGWAFVWGLIELAMAYGPSTSTLLLVVYFAAVGVACVAAGRARDVAGLRQSGLVLALAAACTAIYGASMYFDSGARIVAYLVTSGFLLGIAYWYRRPGSAGVREELG
jgi:predicted membrane protein DUF2339